MREPRSEPAPTKIPQLARARTVNRLARLRARLGAASLALAALTAGAAADRPATAWTFDWAGHAEVDAEALASDDASQRHDAVEALSRYDIELSQKYLLKALDDPEEKVRLEAARALGRSGALAATCN